MLSQAVCTTPMCKDGRTSVQTMWSTFNYLKANTESFNPDRFEATCNSIQASLDAVDSWYADLIPFNPTCCTIDDVGKQADNVTNQMLASVGASSVPTPPPPPDIGSTVLIGGAILLLVVYSPQIKGLFKK